MPSEYKIASKLSYEDLYQVQDYLIDMSDSTITATDVWKDIGKILPTGLTKQQFLKSFTANVKMKRLAGFVIREDKVLLDNIEVAKKNLTHLKNPPKIIDDVQETFRKPLTTMNRTKKVWIKDSCYRVPMAAQDIHTLIERVFLGKKDASGDVILNKEHYQCDTKLLHRYFTEFLGIGPTPEDPHEDQELPDWLLEG